MEIASKWRTPHPEEDVVRRDEEARPPLLPWIHGTVRHTRLLGGARDQLLHVVITANHAVERHDVGGREAMSDVHKISSHELDSTCVTAPLDFLSSDIEV